MSMFKAGRAVGKGVKYLTQLGSKIGKGLGSSVDKLGAGTRKTQAAAIKGVRGVRDAANSAGSAVREGAAAARRGYNTGRNYDLHIDDVRPKPSSGGIKRKTLQEFINTDLKGYIRNPGTMPGSKTTKDGKAVWANGDLMPKPSSGVKKLPSLNEWMNTKGKGMIRNPMTMPGNKPKVSTRPYKDPYGDRMVKRPSGGGIINKPPRPPRPTGGVSPSDYNDWAGRSGNKSIVKQANKMRGDRDIYGNSTGGMSKNRRAGIITGASIAAGYGVHKGNDAIQNHYRQQKNAARGQ